jgi:hypothetical protein
MDAETGEGVEDGLITIVREGILKIPNFFGPPESVKPPKSVEPPKKERKGFFGLFGSKKADPKTAPKPSPPPLIPIPIQTSPTAAVSSQMVDADGKNSMEEVRDLEVQERLNRIEEQFRIFDHQLNVRFAERENSNKDIEEQLMRFETTL